MNFVYRITEQKAVIDWVEEPEPTVVIPEELDGYPVTELGAYALSKSIVEEIHLPSKLCTIGAYAFYGCEKLSRIYCYGRVLDLGAGLFTDVPNVEFLDITLFDGEKSCFKEMLSELRQTLRVRVHMGGGREARLIFPEYYEESVENTPARILFIETHGCGHRYRYCFVNREFQYRGYDELFPHVQVQESEELVAELALGRLLYPCGLTDRYREMYQRYVREHWETAGRLLIQVDGCRPGQVTNLEPGGIRWLARLLVPEQGRVLKQAGVLKQESVPEQAVKADRLSENRSQIGTLIDMAQQAGDTEAVSWLMDFRHRCFSGSLFQGTSDTVPTPSVRTRKRRFEL